MLQVGSRTKARSWHSRLGSIVKASSLCMQTWTLSLQRRPMPSTLQYSIHCGHDVVLGYLMPQPLHRCIYGAQPVPPVERFAESPMLSSIQYSASEVQVIQGIVHWEERGDGSHSVHMLWYTLLKHSLFSFGDAPVLQSRANNPSLRRLLFLALLNERYTVFCKKVMIFFPSLNQHSGSCWGL